MTKEQAIKKIQAIIDCDLRELNTMPQHEALQNEVEALDMAIKALEQQPSEDCVSRKSLLDKLDPLYKEKIKTAPDNMAEGFLQVSNLIKYEPPVTPTFPKGATNGDVIKAMFPNIEADEIKTNTGGYIEVKYLDTTDKRDATAFRKSWWNAPYKRGDLDGSN